MNSEEGSAAFEMIFFVPIIAVFLVITVQFFEAGVVAMRELISLEDEVAQAVGSTPCPEDVPIGVDGRQRTDGRRVDVGIGSWRFPVELDQEVVFVTEHICSP